MRSLHFDDFRRDYHENISSKLAFVLQLPYHLSGRQTTMFQTCYDDSNYITLKSDGSVTDSGLRITLHMHDKGHVYRPFISHSSRSIRMSFLFGVGTYLSDEPHD